MSELKRDGIGEIYTQGQRRSPPEDLSTGQGTHPRAEKTHMCTSLDIAVTYDRLTWSPKSGKRSGPTTRSISACAFR